MMLVVNNHSSFSLNKDSGNNLPWIKTSVFSTSEGENTAFDPLSFNDDHNLSK